MSDHIPHQCDDCRAHVARPTTLQCDKCYRKALSKRRGNRYIYNKDKILANNMKYGLSPKGRISKFKVAARHRKIELHLTDEQILQFRDHPCFYCSRTYHSEFDKASAWVDRLDSSQGYTPENTVSCCGTCNMLKRDDVYSVDQMKVFGKYLAMAFEELKLYETN